MHPTVHQLLQGKGIEVVMLEPAAPCGGHEMGVLEHLEMLHHSEPAHVELLLQFGQRLSVLRAEAVHQRAAGRVVEGFEDRVHDILIRDFIVT